MTSLYNELLQEQGSFFKNYKLLNDCKVTKEFIRLYSRKLGYNDVVKLTSKDKNNVVTETITDPTEIRGRMASTFQNIFNKQHVDNSSNSIKNFLAMGNEEEPLNELKRRALPD